LVFRADYWTAVEKGIGRVLKSFSVFLKINLIFFAQVFFLFPLVDAFLKYFRGKFDLVLGLYLTHGNKIISYKISLSMVVSGIFQSGHAVLSILLT